MGDSGDPKDKMLTRSKPTTAMILTVARIETAITAAGTVGALWEQAGTPMTRSMGRTMARLRNVHVAMVLAMRKMRHSGETH